MSILYILFYILILTIGLFFILIGGLYLKYGKIYNTTLTKFQSIVMIVAGFFVTLLAMVFIIMIIVNIIRKPTSVNIASIEDTEQFNPLPFDENNPELEMLIRIIFASYYKNKKYSGSNLRNDYYYRFFENVGDPELGILNKTPDTPEGDTSFNDDRILVLYRVYKKYIDTKFDICDVLGKLELFINKSNDPILSENQYMVQNTIYMLQLYIAVVKLVRRDLIPIMYGELILNKIKPFISQFISRKSAETMNESIDSEIARTDYHPVVMLHSNGIRFNNRLPDNYIAKYKFELPASDD